MNNIEALSALQLLKDKIQNYNLMKEKMEQAAEQLKAAESRQPKAVLDFDLEHERPFIISQIGEAPVKPTGIIKLAVPLYLKRIKAYEQESADYTAKYEEYKKVYQQKYADQRSRLEKEEAHEILFDIQIAKHEFEYSKTQLETYKHEIESSTIVSEKFKNIEAIDTLISYLREQRADNLKEAMNLYYEEEHRRKLEELAQEQLRLTAEATEMARQAAKSAKEAAESAEKAADSAEEAEENAEEAISQANRAMERADEAYEKAEEAYNEAQDAHYAGSSYDY